MPPEIKFGYCYLVDMNPPRKSKPGKVRPVIVIESTDVLQAGSPGVVIVPLTTQIREGNILRVRIEASALLKLEKESDVLLDQVHTVDRTLFLKELGPLSPETMNHVTEGVRFLLGF